MAANADNDAMEVDSAEDVEMAEPDVANNVQMVSLSF